MSRGNVCLCDWKIQSFIKRSICVDRDLKLTKKHVKCVQTSQSEKKTTPWISHHHHKEVCLFLFFTTITIPNSRTQAFGLINPALTEKKVRIKKKNQTNKIAVGSEKSLTEQWAQCGLEKSFATGHVDVVAFWIRYHRSSSIKLEKLLSLSFHPG